jgi:hypothetical protein
MEQTGFSWLISFLNNILHHGVSKDEMGRTHGGNERSIHDFERIT